jgi:hypothetical protein
MSDIFWIVLGIVLTSPFWMIVLIILIAGIVEIFEKFFDLIEEKFGKKYTFKTYEELKNEQKKFGRRR